MMGLTDWLEQLLVRIPFWFVLDEWMARSYPFLHVFVPQSLKEGE
jgi:hypothetical protein